MFIEDLLKFEIKLHVMHLRSNNYAEHMALGSAYSDYSDWVDSFVESFQGYDNSLVVSNIKEMVIDLSIQDPVEVINKFINITLDLIKKEFTEDDWVVNSIQEVEQMLYATLYKLEFLK